MSILVTTGARPTPPAAARAREVAERTGGLLVERRGSLPKLLERHGAELAYIVGREAEWVQSRTGKLSVDVGLLHAKVSNGDQHPLIRALGPVEHVLDGTLGLAGDALHIAAATGARVDGAEASPWVAELVTAGLAGLSTSRWADAAARITPHALPSHELAARLGQVDAAFVAPMFEVPARAAPGFELFRQLADHRPFDDTTFEVLRSITPRIVVRVEKGAPAPMQPMELLQGRAVDYWIWERGWSA